MNSLPLYARQFLFSPLKRSLSLVSRPSSSSSSSITTTATPLLLPRYQAKRCYATETATTTPSPGQQLRKKLQEDLVAATKGGDANKLAAIRLIKSKITYKDKESGGEADLAGIIGVLSAMATAAKETEKEMVTHNREDLANKERLMIDTIKQYMPAQLSKEDIAKEAQAAITELNATSLRDIGKVIGVLTKKLGTQAQPQAIGEVVRELLSKPK